MPKTLQIKLLLAEGFGTFMLVLVGTGAVVIDGLLIGLGPLGIALAFGGVVWLMIGLFGRLSGAHINPAVSIGFVAAGTLTRGLAAAYIGVQIVGGVLASLLVLALAGEHPHLGATTPAVPLTAALGIEIALTCGLMSVILWVVHRPVSSPWIGGAAIGGWVGLAAWTAGWLTGASMNPARSLGPAVASGRLEDQWLYIVAPVIGALLAVGLCRAIKGDADCCRACQAPA